MIVADTHAHLYACFDPGRALAGALARMRALGGPGAATALCLVERAGQDWFGRLEDKGAPGLDVAPGPEPGTLALRSADGGEAWLLAGRQVVTAENLEVLALGLQGPCPDGPPARDVIARIRDEGAVAVLPFGVGKWFFGRGRVVRALLDDPGGFLLGDSTQRPRGWSEPRLMAEGRRRGFGVVAGSDPLPLRGEERFLGAYATRFDAPFDRDRPATCLRRVLGDASLPRVHVGSRPGPATALRRQWRLRREPAEPV